MNESDFTDALMVQINDFNNVISILSEVKLMTNGEDRSIIR